MTKLTFTFIILFFIAGSAASAQQKVNFDLSTSSQAVNLFDYFNQKENQKNFLLKLKSNEDKIYYQNFFLNLKTTKAVAYANEMFLTYVDSKMGFNQIAVIQYPHIFWVNGKIISLAQENPNLTTIGAEIFKKMNIKKTSLRKLIFAEAYATGEASQDPSLMMFLAILNVPSTPVIRVSPSHVLDLVEKFSAFDEKISCGKFGVSATGGKNNYSITKASGQSFAVIKYHDKTLHVHLPYLGSEGNKLGDLEKICKDNFASKNTEMYKLCRESLKPILNTADTGKIVNTIRSPHSDSMNPENTATNKEIEICEMNTCRAIQWQDLNEISKIHKLKDGSKESLLEEMDHELSVLAVTSKKLRCEHPAQEQIGPCQNFKEQALKVHEAQNKIFRAVKTELLESALGIAVAESYCGDEANQRRLYDITGIQMKDNRTKISK